MLTLTYSSVDGRKSRRTERDEIQDWRVAGIDEDGHGGVWDSDRRQASIGKNNRRCTLRGANSRYEVIIYIFLEIKQLCLHLVEMGIVKGDIMNTLEQAHATYFRLRAR